MSCLFLTLSSTRSTIPTSDGGKGCQQVMKKRNRGLEAAMPMPILPMLPKEEPILTREQVAEKLQVTPKFVDEIRRSRCANRLKFFKVGKYVRSRN